MGPTLGSSKNKIQGIRKANAAGFAKRQSRKSKATSADVYEYTTGKNKRSAITLSLDKEEALGLGSDGDGDTDGLDHNALRARIMSTGDDADAINSENDEEIESDDAFEESDEERFAGFSFSSKPKPSKKPKVRNASSIKVRFSEVNLDEDDDNNHRSKEDSGQDQDDEEGDSDEFLDVLDVLDGRGEPDSGDDTERQSGGDKIGQDEDAQEDDKDGEDDDDEEEQQDDEMMDSFAPSDTEQQSDGEALDNLGAFVSQLETGKKRKADDGSTEVDVSSGPEPNRKRRMLKERTEAGVESEFGVHAASGSKLRLDDLLAPLASTSSLLALKESTKTLTKGDALPAPLPQRTQDRLDREAAYEQTKDEVDKWKATMKRIKEADHLSFPLQVPQKITPSSSGLVAKFKPTTELESAVDKLLKAAQMRDEEDITKAEELKMNNLSVEEVAERRAELRKMRELMFRAEAKAKRVAKIKSKTYRKIQRKGREKINNLIKEADGLDSAEPDEEERMKHEVERARERATLRHKNTGKWAKAMKGRGELDVDQRQDIEEMLEKGERLRLKIRGAEESDDDGDDDAEDDLEGIKTSAFDELERLKHNEETTTPVKAKGVFGMKFMQDAMAREAKRVDKVADDFRDEMARIGRSDDEAGDGDDSTAGPSSLQVERVGGRMTFRPGQMTITPWPVAASDSSSTLKSSEPALQSPAVASQHTIRSSPPAPSENFAQLPSPSPHPPSASEMDPNPWLQPRKPVVTQSRRRNEILVGKDSTGADKSENQMKKHLMKNAEEREKARDDAIIEISTEGVLKLPDEDSQATKAKTTKPKNRTNAQNGQQVDAAFVDSDAESEVEAQEQQTKAKGNKKGVKAFEQRDLVALAFAGDNVVQDFDKLKKREIEADAPREEDHTLPGWGSWGGAGTRPNPRARKFTKKIAGIDPASRADHGKPHLIISEKKDKKAAKYLTRDLPYPYTSKAQFEKSMEIPIGTEWNTRVGFQRQTLPRVVKKMGTVIDPLEKLF